MLEDIYSKRQRLREFFADSAKSFSLIWDSGKRLTIANLLLFVFQSIIPILSLLVLKNLIDTIINTGKVNADAYLYLVWFGCFLILNAIIMHLSAYYLAVQQQRISDDIAVKVLEKSIEIDLQFYESPGFYDELHMIQQQSSHKPALLIAAIQGIIQNLTSVILLSGFMFMIHWSIFLLILVLGIPLSISKILNGYYQFQLDKDCIPVNRKASDIYTYLTAEPYAKEVRIFNFGSDFINQFRHLRNFIFTKKRQLHYRFLIQSIAVQVFEIAAAVAIYCILITTAIKGMLSVGSLVIYFQVFQRLQVALAGFFQGGINLLQHQLYLRQILKYLSTISVINKPDLSGVPENVPGIKVVDLSFTYPQTNKQILHNISIDIAPGRIVAVVGENGSGKSTFIKLLCRLYDVEKGKIFFGGADVKDIDTNKLRSRITAVFQDYGKYYLTIEDNITLGNNKKDNVLLNAVAEKSGLIEKIKSFPAGYKTILGRTFLNGEQLSGGQWQKIALARGFYKDSDLLILDEPTSSMDPLAEYKVFNNLKDNIGNQMIILITHRLYNLKLADEIYVMKDGHIAERGTFSELINAKGVFANMYDKQTV